MHRLNCVPLLDDSYQRCAGHIHYTKENHMHCMRLFAAAVTSSTELK